MKHIPRLLSLLFIIALGQSVFSQNKEYTWPIEIEGGKGGITTLYQPELDSFEDGFLEGRMAVTYKPLDGEVVFGAIWFKSKMYTNFTERTVILEEMHITKTHFPGDATDEQKEKFTAFIQSEVESWDLEMSLDRILADLDDMANLNKLADNINNDAPKIYYRTKPAVLVLIDGEPILKQEENSKIEYVVNSPFFLVREGGADQFYLKGGEFWYTSEGIKSGWKETREVPGSIEAFAAQNEANNEEDTIALKYDSAPEIIVESKAAELVILDGEPDYKAIDSTTLLYVSNTESDIIMDINSQKHYMLLAGRWYTSQSIENWKWEYCEPSDLPEDFKKIPEGSAMESVRASIPGTVESEAALLEHTIPQTATVDRETASVEVSYDGAPEFKAIEDIGVSYALNTDKTVLQINDLYYCVDEAIWFISGGPEGPWIVADSIPSVVNSIPPESPVYNVKYTYIYESTPDVVYVGYTPGYTYSYVYGGTVVYGTGYYYPYWYGHYYYPRPVTWGYGVHYNPYTGWGFSVGISYGWIGWGYHPYYRSYWGPRGYHHGYRHGHRRGYHSGYRAGYHAGKHQGGKPHGNRNVYSNRKSGVKSSSNKRPQGNHSMNNKARSNSKQNNMYSDKKGNVYQRDKQGNYDRKSNNKQNQPSTKPSQNQKPSQSQPSTRPNQGYDKQQLDRSYQNRSQGNQNYNRSQQQRSGGGSRPSGGGRSGGGGGRR